jgi:hypothetical protein
MNMAIDDEQIEELLRADRATPVPDDGFVERLLTQLPRRRERRWIAPLMTVVGALLAMWSLGGPQAALSLLWQTQVAGAIPLILLLPFVAVLASSLWAMAESR